MGGVKEHKENNWFIIQTSKDYDMPYHEVERILSIYPNDFYNKLEEYIEMSAN